jgi:hypothetical protein
MRRTTGFHQENYDQYFRMEFNYMVSLWVRLVSVNSNTEIRFFMVSGGTKLCGTEPDRLKYNSG